MEEYEKRRQHLAEKLAKANTARDFGKTEQGQLALEMNNERISFLMNQAFGKTPLTYEMYLSTHGAVRELQIFSNMLYAKQANIDETVKELEVVDQQIKDVKQANGQSEPEQKK